MGYTKYLMFLKQIGTVKQFLTSLLTVKTWGLRLPTRVSSKTFEWFCHPLVACFALQNVCFSKHFDKHPGLYQRKLMHFNKEMLKISFIIRFHICARTFFDWFLISWCIVRLKYIGWAVGILVYFIVIVQKKTTLICSKLCFRTQIFVFVVQQRSLETIL